jgi:uncharacterized membrane protein YgdD (TMEM256/DUF423 family)
MMNAMAGSSQKDRGISRRSKRLLFGVGLVVYVGGLYLLTFVNAMADNWAGVVSPLCIIGGLVTIFISLVLRPEEAEDRERETES